MLVPNDIRYYQQDELPAYWPDETYERTQHWLTACNQFAIAVPSLLVPLSYNIILHPAHPYLLNFK